MLEDGKEEKKKHVLYGSLMCKENMEIIAFASDNVPTSEYISHGIVLVWCCCRRGSVKLISHIHDGREAGKGWFIP